MAVVMAGLPWPVTLQWGAYSPLSAPPFVAEINEVAFVVVSDTGITI